MKKVNLRDLYPDVYKNDYFVEVPSVRILGIGLTVWGFILKLKED